MKVDDDADSLDKVLIEVGDLGRYQVATFLLLCILNILSGASTLNYVISANTLDYRYVYNRLFFDGLSFVFQKFCWKTFPKKWIEHKIIDLKFLVVNFQ